MGELILLYYLKVFSIILITIFFLSILYFFYILNTKITLNKKLISINKNESFDKIFDTNFNSITNSEIVVSKFYYRINNLIFKRFIHYGDFYIEDNVSIVNFLNIISKPSNILNKITIIEGWSNDEINNELSKYFNEYYDIKYEDIIADTYFFDKNIDFDSFIKNLSNIKYEYFEKYLNSPILETYSKEEIMIIGSLIEKEGLDSIDKKKISSVIFNRLNNNMKLQIDATVLFAITNGKYNLGRKLLLKDLKYIHPYNTYLIKGLPPGPISYVGKKTLDIIFENYKSDFLFYFFNNSLNRHIFSKTYKDHKKKLNEFRNN